MPNLEALGEPLGTGGDAEVMVESHRPRVGKALPAGARMKRYRPAAEALQMVELKEIEDDAVTKWKPVWHGVEEDEPSLPKRPGPSVLT